MDIDEVIRHYEEVAEEKENRNTHHIAMCLDIIGKHQMALDINPQPSVSSEEYCKRCNETQAEGAYDD